MTTFTPVTSGKNIHTKISGSIYRQISKIAKQEGCTKSAAYNALLKRGLEVGTPVPSVTRRAKTVKRGPGRPSTKRR